jgi:methylamine--corrinoid protein Co-methyltransferase
VSNIVRTLEEILVALDRAHTGPIYSSHDWDVKIIPRKIEEKLTEHGLKGTCNPKESINTDDGLADEFWKAGFELAADTGMLCLTTERVIKFSEEELRKALRDAPSRLIIGKGLDKLEILPRKPEDVRPPVPQFGPFGIAIDEDIFIPVHMATFQHRVIKGVAAGTISTILGREIRAGTPYETLAGKYDAMLVHEALRRSGRPGMVGECVDISPTEYGQLGGYGIPDGYENDHLYLILWPNELKTDYMMLHKTAHAFNCNAPVQSGTFNTIGGFAGPPEGAALVNVASAILQIPVHQVTVNDSTINDIKYLGSSGWEAIWANSVAFQAKSRNTHTLQCFTHYPVAGPCTDMLLYEAAVLVITSTVSGSTYNIGMFTSGGRYPNRTGVLENVLAAEVSNATAGMKRSDANEIVKNLIPKYEEKLTEPPIGKTIQECFDLKTLQPTKEWEIIYEKVKKDLKELSVQFEL